MDAQISTTNPEAAAKKEKARDETKMPQRDKYAQRSSAESQNSNKGKREAHFTKTTETEAIRTKNAKAEIMPAKDVRDAQAANRSENESEFQNEKMQEIRTSPSGDTRKIETSKTRTKKIATKNFRSEEGKTPASADEEKSPTSEEKLSDEKQPATSASKKDAESAPGTKAAKGKIVNADMEKSAKLPPPSEGNNDSPAGKIRARKNSRAKPIAENRGNDVSESKNMQEDASIANSEMPKLSDEARAMQDRDKKNKTKKTYAGRKDAGAEIADAGNIGAAAANASMDSENVNSETAEALNKSCGGGAKEAVRAGSESAEKNASTSCTGASAEKTEQKLPDAEENACEDQTPPGEKGKLKNAREIAQDEGNVRAASANNSDSAINASDVMTETSCAPVRHENQSHGSEKRTPKPGIGASENLKKTCSPSIQTDRSSQNIFSSANEPGKESAAEDFRDVPPHGEPFPQNHVQIKDCLDIRGKNANAEKHVRIPSYPPEDKGLPAASAEAIMNTQKVLIGEIRRKLALGDDLFEMIVRPSLLAFAGYAHLLPASEHNHHNAAGGLWRHSLETASIALDLMETAAGFAPDMELSPAKRKQAEAAERVIAFAAALMHDAGKPASDMLVTSDAGTVWDPFTENIDAFLARSGAKRYFVSYLPNRYRRHEYFASVLAGRFATPDLMSWLSSVSPETVRTLLLAIYPEEGYAHLHSKAALIAKTVKDADCMSASRDLRRRLYVADNASLGIRPIEQALGIMRDLVSEGTWKTNAPGARLWHTRDGLFLAWSGGFSDISQKLKDCVPNICPALAADWLRLLAGSGIIEENPAALEGCIFMGRPEGVKSDKIRFVRFTDPRILLKDPLPAPVGIEYSGAKPLSAMLAAGAKIADEHSVGAAPTPDDKEAEKESCGHEDEANNFRSMLGRAFADKLRADNPDINIPQEFNGKEAKIFVKEIKKIRAEAAKETKTAVKEALKTQKKKSAADE